MLTGNSTGQKKDIKKNYFNQGIISPEILKEQKIVLKFVTPFHQKI
jgi:hypothetical protein